MFGLGKLLGKKRKEVQVTLHKVENKDLMEAIIAGAILVAYADGDCSSEELTTLQGIIDTNDNLKHFGSEIGQTIDKYAALYESSKRMAKIKLMKEIADVAADEEQKIEAFIIAIDIADADGEINEDELKVLREIGKTLGLNPETYI